MRIMPLQIITLCLAGTFIKCRLNLAFGCLAGGFFLRFFAVLTILFCVSTLSTLSFEIGLAGTFSRLTFPAGQSVTTVHVGSRYL
jgi:hypothetical protein